MSEAMMPANKTNDLVAQMAYSVQTLAESMGVLSNKIKNHEERITNQEVKTDALETRMTNFEDNERISRSQAQRMKIAVKERIGELLGIEWEKRTVVRGLGNYKKYYGGFIRRLWSDVKLDSYCPESYTDTRKRDYEEVMKYIREWEPKAGVDGQMEFIDRKREEK